MIQLQHPNIWQSPVWLIAGFLVLFLVQFPLLYFFLRHSKLSKSFIHRYESAGVITLSVVKEEPRRLKMRYDPDNEVYWLISIVDDFAVVMLSHEELAANIAEYNLKTNSYQQAVEKYKAAGSRINQKIADNDPSLDPLRVF